MGKTKRRSRADSARLLPRPVEQAQALQCRELLNPGGSGPPELRHRALASGQRQVPNTN